MPGWRENCRLRKESNDCEKGDASDENEEGKEKDGDTKAAISVERRHHWCKEWRKSSCIAAGPIEKGQRRGDRPFEDRYPHPTTTLRQKMRNWRYGCVGVGGWCGYVSE